MRATLIGSYIQSLRVLVADDYPDVVDSLALVIAAHGHDVQIARHGLEAVEYAASFRPDIILLDIGMPRLDGYTAARRIREQLGSGVTLIALTSWVRDEDKQQAKMTGFDQHVAKPADPQELINLLTTLGAQKYPCEQIL